MSDHRAAPDDPVAFARSFIDGRLRGFEKDIRICLTPVKSETRPGNTHAYFPALSACCSLLEYLTAMHRGNTRGIGSQQISAFARQYLPQPDYDSDTVRILFEALRHPVAHRGIASGVWVDRVPGGNQRRVVWQVDASTRRPACRLVEKNGVLRKDPPWPTPYTHRVHISLRKLSADIRDAARAYSKAIVNDAALVRNFQACMRQLYPL